MLQTSVADPHPVEDFEAAVLAIPPAGLICLNAVARLLHGSTGMDPSDLLQEAYLRALAGSRSWSRDIDVVKFLIGAMESIADSSRAMVQRRQLSVVARGDFSPGNIEGLASRTGVLFEGHAPLRPPRTTRCAVRRCHLMPKDLSPGAMKLSPPSTTTSRGSFL